MRLSIQDRFNHKAIFKVHTFGSALAHVNHFGVVETR